MKVKNLFFSAFIFCGLFSFINLNAQNYAKQTPTYIQGPPQRTCGTETPSQQWEELFQKQIAEFLAANPELNSAAKQGSGNSTQAVYTIPVIIHVIHGGQAVGTFPNLAQGQLNSQIQVLNDDFAGVGYNISNYPANAFTAWATNTTIAAASKDGLGRIKIANTGVTFCLALKDTLGNTLAEPGIHRVNYSTITAPLTGTFTSKDPANAVYNTSGKFQGFINGYIKPNTIWNVSKYMNLWVTDEQAAVGLLGYATFPPLSTLVGIPGGTGTSTSDGFWSWAGCFGSKVLYPAGTYATGYDLGRTCTHEIGHWVGLRHIWGDGTCATDYCNDTPPASASNFVNCPTTYPYKSGSCAGPPSNAPNGEMFQNFMDYSYDCAMFMFTEDQRTRLQVAMANSPYRKFLGTHGLCSVPPPVANFSFSPNPACVGQTVSIIDLSTGSPGAWSYTMTGGAPTTSTLQNPFVTYAAAGVYSITLVSSNGGGSSAPIVKTITISAAPIVTVTASPSTVCAGSSATLTASGATTYSWSTSATTSSIVVTPSVLTTYTVTGANGSCTNTKTISVAVSGSPTVNIAPGSTTICAGNTAIFTGSGATNYTWMPGGNTTATISVTPTLTTTYTLTGTNAAGCAGTRTVQVTVNSTPTVTATANPTILCSGGSSTLTASGATTYTWMPGSLIGATVVVTPTTNTTYTVTGVNGTCSNTRTVSITIGSSPTLNINPPSATVCVGSSATFFGSGAVNYTWMPSGINTASINVTPTITTTYTLTGANASGCTSTRTTQVVVNSLPIVTITSNPLTICPGSSATLTASGSGPGPFTYSWSTGSTAATITSSIVGVYTATVTNGNGCKGSLTYSLNAAAGLTINIAATPTAVCAGGSVTLTASGATTYTWNTGPTTSSIVVTPTTTTNYTVNGTSGSCTGSKTISISVNPNPTVTAIANPASVCSGASSTLTASGASTYSWSTGSNSVTSVVSPTSTTTYTVVGTSSLGCSVTRTVTVSNLSAPVITVTASSFSICPGSTSTLTANGSGPPGPFSYLWNTGATTAVITTSVGGVYTATFTNGNGCMASQSVTITAIPAVTINISATPTAVCAGSSATLTASGATTYTWNTGPTTSSVVVTPSVLTTYTVNGSNGSCTSSRTISIAVNANPTVNVVASPTLVCAGSTSTLTASGATTYSWSTGATTTLITVTPTTSTTYTVTGMNAAGCSNTRTVTVNTIAAPSVSVTATPTSMCSGSTATIIASGATTYSWNTGATTAVIAVTPTATTNYTVTGSNGTCTNTKTISLTVNTTPTITVVASPTIICSGNSSNITASGATTYSWSTGATTSGISVSPSITATYTVTGSNGSCSNTRTVSVAVIGGPSISISSSSSVICVGQTAVLTASGSATTYTWSTGSNSITISVSPTITTNYTVNGTNAAGCTSSTIIAQSVSPCTGISNSTVANMNFGVYPNPNNGEFTVTVEKVTENTYVEIYNTIGQLVNKQLVKDYSTKINLTEQADGIYYVIIAKDSKHLHKAKVIKD